LAYSTEDPCSLKDLSDFAIRLDNRLHDRRMDKSGGLRPTPGPYRSSGSGRLPSSTDSSTPMDLDGTTTSRRFKPLTEAEKKRRRDNNLCLYCGDAGHKANECPKKARPARFQATLGPYSDSDLRQSKNESA
jgi:hypothetical protein